MLRSFEAGRVFVVLCRALINFFSYFSPLRILLAHLRHSSSGCKSEKNLNFFLITASFNFGTFDVVIIGSTLRFVALSLVNRRRRTLLQVHKREQRSACVGI